VYHQIQISDFPRWVELDAGIEVRNSIAHALGRLTPRQNKGNAASKISQIGVAIQDGNIEITDSGLRQCRDVCIEFVRYLDEKMQSASSS
jgi:hypothetical protein